MQLSDAYKIPDEPFSSRIRRLGGTDALLIICITLLALSLRLVGIEAQGLWHDELYTLGNLAGFNLYLFPGSDLGVNEPLRPAGHYVNRLNQDLFWQNIIRNIVHEGHPPLYIFLLKVWTFFTGASPSMIKLFSVMTSTIAVPLMFLSGKQLGCRKVAIIAAILFATSPFQVYFSTEARSYGLLTMLAAGATYSALILHNTRLPSRAQWAAWILSASAMCLTHYFAAVYCFLLVVFLIFYSQTKSTKKIGPLFLAVMPLIIFSAWLPVLYFQVTAHGSGHWTQGSLGLWSSMGGSLSVFLELLLGQSGGSIRPELAFLILLLAISSVITIRYPPTTLSPRLLFFFLALPSHVFIVFIIDTILDHHTISVARYSSCLAIPLTLILASAFVRLRSTGFVLALFLTLSTTYGSILTANGDRTPRQMILEVATYINQNSKLGDIVVVTPSGPTLVGLARHLKPGTLVTATPATSLAKLLAAGERRPGQTVWSVQQRLGLSNESWSDSTTPPPKSLTRFVGVDLATY